MVQAGCSHQMAEIIGFKIQSFCKSYRFFRAVSFCYIHGGVNVAVFTLGALHYRDNLVYELIQFRILVDGVDRNGSFEPFVEISVVKWRAIMFAFIKAGCNFKVSEGMAAFCIVKYVPHKGNHCVLTNIKTFLPKSAGEAGSLKVGAWH